ncbi:unnamed protein product, partial [marine sediment metagenome]
RSKLFWFLGVENLKAFNDDRFARALDKLYLADRASLMTGIVVKMIEEVDLELSRILRRFNDGKGLWENKW